MKKLIISSLLFFVVFSGFAQEGQVFAELPLSININSDYPVNDAQDTIVKRNGGKIICIVKEINTTEIKYILPAFNPDVLNAVERKDVLKIIYGNGKVQNFEEENENVQNIERNSADLYQMQKKNALKLDFISLATNVMTLTYERCLKPGRSLEFSLGVVGLGVAEKKDHASGILFRGGYKFLRNPDFYLKGMRYAHIMKGPYLKLEFDFASYGIEGYKDIFDETKEHYTLTKWGIMMVLGNQWVFNDNFVVDLYSGLGIGKNNLQDFDLTYPYGFVTLGKGFPMAMSFGLRIGFLIK